MSQQTKTIEKIQLKNLTMGEIKGSNSKSFFNTKTKKSTQKGRLVKQIEKAKFNDDDLSSLVVLPPSGKQWDKLNNQWRTHDSSCEFGKGSCSCWCNDEYHGIKAVI